jgi:hypothetical protein
MNRPRRGLRFSHVLAVILPWAGLISVPARADDAPLVRAIEAVFLTKFSAFVEWPRDASVSGEGSSRSRQSALCVLGGGEIADDAAVAERKIGEIESQLTVRAVTLQGCGEGCRILFIGADVASSTIAAALRAVSGAPTLTVTDRAAAGGKGIINFVLANNRVRFEIDDSEAARHQLRISSKLLSIATAVKPRS